MKKRKPNRVYVEGNIKVSDSLVLKRYGIIFVFFVLLQVVLYMVLRVLVLDPKQSQNLLRVLSTWQNNLWLQTVFFFGINFLFSRPAVKWLSDGYQKDLEAPVPTQSINRIIVIGFFSLVFFGYIAYRSVKYVNGL